MSTELNAAESFIASFDSEEAVNERSQRDSFRNKNIKAFQAHVGHEFEIDFEYPLNAVLEIQEETPGFSMDGDFWPILSIPDSHIWSIEEIEEACANEFYASL
jgi:hypothetical protein